MSGSTGTKQGQESVALHRLALLAFAALLILLFLVIGISEGIGKPSIPSGDVAIVEGVPGKIGNVTQKRFDHALEQMAARAGLKKAPKPGDDQYDELKESALGSLFESIWLQGLADELGITVSNKEIAAELKKAKDENFKSGAEFKKFLKERKYNKADVREMVLLQKLSADIQAQIAEEAPKPTKGEIENYYEAAKATQFTQQPSRDLRLIVNKKRAKVERARWALAKDNSEKNWEKVAKKYSEDAATKSSGGQQSGVQESTLEEPLDAAVFDAPKGKLEGPLDAPRGFTLFEVTNSSPKSVQDLKSVESQIESTLAQRKEQEFFTAYVANFTSKWSGRTFCADGYVIERCRNYKGSGHPSTAAPACYEADPKTPAKECPAPVTQAKPALPGTVTPLEPRGSALAQRPNPGTGTPEAAALETSSP